MAQDLYQAAGVQPQAPSQEGPVDLYQALQHTSVSSRTNPFLKGAGKVGAPVLDFLHHATGGLTDKEIAALQAAGIMGGGVDGEGFSDRYHGSLKNFRNNLEEWEGDSPATAKGAKVAGVVAPMAITGPAAAAEQSMAQAAGKSAATGAGFGAAYGFGGTDDESLAQDLTATGVGAAAGGAAGAALPVGLGIAKAPFRMARNATSVFGKDGIEAAAGRVLNESKTNGNIFEKPPLPDMSLTTGQTTNDPGLLWLERNVRDASPRGATLTGEAMAKNTAAIRGGITRLGDVEADAGHSMRSSVLAKMPEISAQDQVLDMARGQLGGGGFHSTIEHLNTTRKGAAAPLYEKAMQGGSIAPLEDQLRAELTAATGAKGQIAKQIRDIETNNPGALAARGAAGVDVRTRYMDLRSKLDQAEKDRQAVLSMFQRAKSDKSSNAPGAVWSPRIQDFLDDPILKQGLSKGVQIQRLEALAEGKKFDPTEIGITGTDANGHPIISSVPNMRVLDAGKKGLDAIVEGYRNPITHKLELDQYGNAVNQVRASYLNEMDRLNPDYKSARAAWSGPSQSLDALHSGRNIFSSDPEFTSARMANLSPGDMEYYRLGVMRALSDKVANSANGATALDTLLAKPNVQTKLTSAFGSPEAFQSFRQKAADLLNPQTDIGKAIARDNAGNFKLPTSAVADQFIRSGKGAPEAFKSYLDAISTKEAGGKVTYDQEGLKAAQDAFAQKFLKQVSNTGQDANGQNVVSPAKMQKFLADYGHVINSPMFTPAQRDLVKNIAKATQMANRTANARPPGGGSDTFPKLQGDKFIDALVGPHASKLVGAVGKVGGAAWGALEEGKIGAVMGFMAGEKGGELVNSLYKAPRDKVVALITEAMHDPELAKDLMMKASNTNAKLLPAPRRAKIYGVLGAQATQPAVKALTTPQ